MLRQLIKRQQQGLCWFSSSRSRVQKFSKKPFDGRVRYISDIHFDHNKFSEYPMDGHIDTPYLVVAGDLGRLQSDWSKIVWFFQTNSREFEQMVYVPGNHEFYTEDHPNSWMTYEELKNRARSLEHLVPNLTVLMRDRLILDVDSGLYPKIVVLGCTLWSGIPMRHKKRFEDKIVDFTKIIHCDENGNPRPRIVEDNNAEFLKDKLWLEENIQRENDSGSDVLVVTHHAPLVKESCLKRFLYNGQNVFDRSAWCNYAYSSDLGHLIRYPAVKGWIFGHTHYRANLNYEGTVVVSNPIGKCKQRYQSVRTI